MVLTRSWRTVAQRRRVIAVWGGGALAAASLTVFTYSAGADPALPASATSFKDGRYIVQFVDEPVAVYDGGVPGLEATTPDDGERISFDSAAVQDYRAHLEQARDEILSEVPGVEPDAEYDTAFNGVAVELTAAEARELAGDERVAAVIPDQLSRPQLDTSAEFLGLSGEDGTWESKSAAASTPAKGSSSASWTAASPPRTRCSRRCPSPVPTRTSSTPSGRTSARRARTLLRTTSPVTTR